MQNAQLLSQPIWMVTHEAWATSRWVGSAEGKASDSASTVSSQISVTGPCSRDWCSRSTARCTLWVPKTTSTWPARSRMVSRSFWARQPPTTISRSGREAFTDLR